MATIAWLSPIETALGMGLVVAVIRSALGRSAVWPDSRPSSRPLSTEQMKEACVTALQQARRERDKRCSLNGASV